MKPIVIKNAVLYKDMVMGAKKSKLLVITMICNIMMGFIATVALVIMQILGMSQETISQQFLLIYFLIAMIMESIMIAFIVPAITAGCISIEKERQTLEILLTTRMTPWQIIIGKYTSAISMVLMMILTSIPSLALVYIYGGISEWRMILMIATLIAVAMFIASIGVFFSALIKNTVVSVIITYIILWMIVTLSISVVTTIWILSAALSEYLYKEFPFISQMTNNSQFFTMDWCVLLLYLNPAVTVFDVMGQAFGYGLGSSVSVNGMVTVMSEISDWSEHNLLTVLWTPISIVLQLLASYGLLKASAVFINPLRGRKKQKKRVKSNSVNA